MSNWMEMIVRARLLVAAMGESAAPPWWRSQATSAAGRHMLERLFPRTGLTASLDLASHAARLEHGRHIGRAGVYHLFRLPPADESAVQAWFERADGTADRVLRQVTGLPPNARLGELATLAVGSSTSATQGPIDCGSVGRLHERATLRQICAIYLFGFQNGRPVYPYLEEAQG